MKLDRTLIDREGVPDPEEIKAYHEKNDITVAGALYDPEEASDVKTAMFVKARDLMRKAWLKEMKKLGRGSRLWLQHIPTRPAVTPFTRYILTFIFVDGFDA